MPTDDPVTPWLAWARRLQSVAQNGLLFSENAFDRERYEAVRAVAAEMLAAGSGLPAPEVERLLMAETGYLTPKADVRGVVFREPDGALLLVRETHDENRWTLPGGWADPGDTPAVAAVREVREESGYTVRATKLLALWDRDTQGHTPRLLAGVFKVFVLCELLGGAPADSHETAGAAFFTENELPAESELSVARTTRAQLLRCFQHRREPGLPTDFD